jgi:uncharacterized protein (TIGR03437 family)
MIRPMCAWLALLAAGPALAQSPAWRIDTVAGSPLNGDGGPAIQALVGAIQGVAADRNGNVYLSDTDHHRVRKVDAKGVIATVAGTGAGGFSGDGGPAAAAQLNLPYGVAADSSGNLYIADLGNNRVRRVAADGTISTCAGGGKSAVNAEGAPATDAVLRTPRNVALDAAGNLYVSEFDGQRVRKVTPEGHIVTVAGTGAAGFGGDGSLATGARLAYPAGLAVDRAGSLYIADSQNQRVRQISPKGVVSTVYGPAGMPTAVAVDPAGVLYISDGSGSIRRCAAGSCAALPGTQSAGDVAMDSAANLYVADGAQLRTIDPRGQVATLAGDPHQLAIGDGGPATSALLLQPSAVALDSAGNLYIADSGTGRVRQVSGSSVIQTVVGTDLSGPMGVAILASGDLLIADTGNHVVRKLSGGALSTVMGTGTAGAGAEGQAPLAEALNGPAGVCAAADGSYYVVDTRNHRVLRVPPGGSVQTAAGNGAAGLAGDGAAARVAQLSGPVACAADASGNLFVADTGNDRIRKIAANGTITTAVSGLSGPRGVAADGAGNLWIADSGNHRICLWSPAGGLQTVIGPDDVHSPGGLALDGAGGLYVADTGNNRVRRVTPPSISVVNAASAAAGPVSPGELVTIFASGIGLSAGTTASFDASGMLPTQLGGAEVRFDGVAAPLLYAGPGQINAQVPYGVTGGSTHIQVAVSGMPAGMADVGVAAATPALFPAPATADKPVTRGSVVTFYGTGYGLTTGSNVAGRAATAPYAQPLLPVALTFDGVAAQLTYAVSAPGILQINATVPGGPAGPASVRLTVGGVTSAAITIWAQ